MNTCPTCLQPYLRIGALAKSKRKPAQTIYIHKESESRELVDYCMGRSPHREGTSIKAGKRVALQSPSVVISSSTTLKNGGGGEINQTGAKLQGEKKMPFVTFDKAALTEKYPSTFGTRVSKPSVAIQDNGRIQFSSEVSKALDGCTVIIPAFDRDTNRIRFDGHAVTPKGKESRSWDITRPKADKDGKVKNKSCGVNGHLMLKEVNYDFKKAGNQTYDVEKFDAEKHIVIFALPKVLPAPRPKVARARKEVAQVAQVNGVASAQTQSARAAHQAPQAPANDDVIVDA